jgi:hypothetical protein
MNLWEGREGSMFLNLAYLGDPNQSCLHLAFRAVFSACIDADLLRLSCFLSVLGRFAVSDVAPSAAFLALTSASSLPGMPVCPAVHLSVREYFLPLVFRRRAVALSVTLR